MTAAIRNGFMTEQAITRRPCRQQRVTTVVIVNSGKLETRSLLWLSSGGRKEWQCTPCRIVEYRRKPPILVPAVHPSVSQLFRVCWSPRIALLRGSPAVQTADLLEVSRPPQ